MMGCVGGELVGGGLPCGLCGCAEQSEADMSQAWGSWITVPTVWVHERSDLTGGTSTLTLFSGLVLQAWAAPARASEG